MNGLANIFKTFARAISALCPNCKEAIRLQSDALDRELPLLKRLGLGFHLIFCKWCRRYGRQIGLLRSVAREHELDDQPSSTQKLSPEARERIKQMLRS